MFLWIIQQGAKIQFYSSPFRQEWCELAYTSPPFQPAPAPPFPPQKLKIDYSSPVILNFPEKTSLAP